MRTDRTTPPAEPAVVAEHLAKEFSLRHARSLKETVMWLARGRRQDISNRFRALEDLSLSIRPGESVALVGLNGSGKSTFLKLVSGVMSPDGGSLTVNGRVAGLIEVGAGFHPDLTGRDNVILVTNEVGSGVVPAHRSGGLFRDLLGAVNQAVGEACDEVHLVVCGRVLRL